MTTRTNTQVTPEAIRKEQIDEAALDFELNDENGGDPRDYFAKGAKWADKNLPWISVKKCLPPIGQKVLICVHIEDNFVATINPKYYTIEWNYRIIKRNSLDRISFDKYGFVTHGHKVFNVHYWMPLPAIPQNANQK